MRHRQMTNTNIPEKKTAPPLQLRARPNVMAMAKDVHQKVIKIEDVSELMRGRVKQMLDSGAFADMPTTPTTPKKIQRFTPYHTFDERHHNR